MKAGLRLTLAASIAVILSLLAADVHVMGIAFWKIVLAGCGLAIIKLSTAA